MKIIFLLDNQQFLEVAPESLQLRQIAPGQSALGIEVTVPVEGKEGETQTGYRPLINYAVDLRVPETKADALSAPDTIPSPVVAKNVAEVKARSGKKNLKVPRAAKSGN